MVATASIACIGLVQQAHAGVTWLVSESDGDLVLTTDGGSLSVTRAQTSAFNPNAIYGLVGANSAQVMVNTSTGGALRWYQDLGSGATSGSSPWILGRQNATSFSGDTFMFSHGDLYWATSLGDGPREITPASTMRFEGLDIATAFGTNLDCGPVVLWTHGSTGDTISIGLAPSFAKPKDIVSFRHGAADPFASSSIYEGVEDTMIVQNNDAAGQRDQNFGARNSFFVGEAAAASGVWPRRSLIRYDLSSLAGEYEKICRVTLRLKVSDVTGDKDGILRVHRLTDANAGWVEGTDSGAGIGDPPDDGETTFNYLIQDSQEWAGSPGAGTPGVDYIETPLASLAIGSTTSGYLDLDLDPSVVGMLIDDWTTNTNAGLFLITAAEDRDEIRFHSSQAAVLEDRPELIIEFIPTVPTLNIAPLANGVRVSWQGGGTRWTLNRSPNLIDWSPITQTPTAGGEGFYVDFPADMPGQFFRIEKN